jgi:tetratricopeptide (TPR) repeat protein
VDDSAAGFALLESVDTDYAGRPGLPWARLYREKAARGIGRWEGVADDAWAFLATTSRDLGLLKVAHQALGNQAFRVGDYAVAEAEFAASASLTQDSDERAMFYQNIAECHSARGDHAGALASLLVAANLDTRANEKAQYLYGAARAAERMGDSATHNSIIARMVAAFPGSAYTTRLVGHEVLPAPEI